MAKKPVQKGLRSGLKQLKERGLYWNKAKKTRNKQGQFN